MATLCRELILRFDLQMLFLVTAFVLCSEWVHVDTIIALDVIGTTAERKMQRRKSLSVKVREGWPCKSR